MAEKIGDLAEFIADLTAKAVTNRLMAGSDWPRVMDERDKALSDLAEAHRQLAEAQADAANYLLDAEWAREGHEGREDEIRMWQKRALHAAEAVRMLLAYVRSDVRFQDLPVWMQEAITI